MTRLQPMRSLLVAPKKKKKKPHASFTFSRISDEKPGIFFIWSNSVYVLQVSFGPWKILDFLISEDVRTLVL